MKNKKAQVGIEYMIIIAFVTLMFTYSRSSFLAGFSVAIFVAFKKKKAAVAFFTLLVLTASIFLLPRPSGEGVKLERLFSIKERFETWKQGIKIFSRYPLLGVGFNTLRYAKIKYYKDGKDSIVSHSGAGIENSYIFVASTTGIFGLAAYIYFLLQIYRHTSTLAQLSLLATIIHAIFLNSLFFPWVMVWLWSLFGAFGKMKQ